MRYAILFFTLLALVGCDEETPHPNQQAVDWAEKLTDQAIAKAEKAECDLQQERRLRDLDKLTHEANEADARAESITWRILLIGLSFVLVIVMVWLAREVRVRRILAHVLRSQTADQEEDES